MNQTEQAAVAELKTCLAGVYALPEADPLRDRMSLDTRDTTLDQLTDKTKATPEQIGAIKFLHPKAGQCRKVALEKIELVEPGAATIFAEEMNKSETALIQLIEGNTTWGAYNAARKENIAAATPKLVAEHQQMMNGLQRSHEAELAQRQAAANAMQEYFQNQQMINAMNRPVMTNCTGFGNSVNCITH
jgi:hypothetical protein